MTYAQTDGLFNGAISTLCMYVHHMLIILIRMIISSVLAVYCKFLPALVLNNFVM